MLKNLTLFFLTSFLVSSAMADLADATVDGDTLNVTFMTDTCNSYGIGLQVDDSCRADRFSEALAVFCDVHLTVRTTKMFCRDQTRVPRVFPISLSESLVSEEVRVLTVKYFNQSIEIELDPATR